MRKTGKRYVRDRPQEINYGELSIQPRQNVLAFPLEGD